MNITAVERVVYRSEALLETTLNFQHPMAVTLVGEYGVIIRVGDVVVVTHNGKYWHTYLVVSQLTTHIIHKVGHTTHQVAQHNTIARHTKRFGVGIYLGLCLRSEMVEVGLSRRLSIGDSEYREFSLLTALQTLESKVVARR